PEIARTFTALRRLREDQVGDDGHVVGKSRLAARERGVPLEAERRAVDGRAQDETDALPAVRVGQRAAERAARLDRMRDATDRELAGDDDLAALGHPAAGREA